MRQRELTKPTAPSAATAGPAQAAASPAAAAMKRAEQRVYLREREGLERRSVLRGLVLLAVIAVLFALLHGGASRAFPAGWWRQW